MKSGFAPILALSLVLLGLGASRFGVIYELAQFQLREHPEAWMLVHAGTNDTAVRRMKTDVVASGDAFGMHWVLERFEERPTLLLALGKTKWLVASSNYAHLLLQNLDVLTHPWLHPPWDARALSIALGAAYLWLVREFTRAAMGPRVAAWTTCLVAGNAFVLWEFGHGHTHVVGTLVLFGAALHALHRSLGGSRRWLALAFVLLVFALSAKITAIGYLAAVGAARLYLYGTRMDLRERRRQWLTSAAAALVAWALLLGANLTLMDNAFYAQNGKLAINLARALHAPWEIPMPVLHQIGMLVNAPVAYVVRGRSLWVVAFVVPLSIYVAGVVGLVRAGAVSFGRVERAWLLCNALFLAQAGVFYFRDASFDLQLAALPVVTVLLVRGFLSLVGTERSWEPRAALGVTALSGLGSVFSIGAVPLYGFDLGTQERLIRTLSEAHPAAIVTIDPMTAYAVKWLEPALPVVYFQGAHQQLRHAPDREILPALRSFLAMRHADMAVLPERPLFEMPRTTPWSDVKDVFESYYGAPRLVGDGVHEGALVYRRAGARRNDHTETNLMP